MNQLKKNILIIRTKVTKNKLSLQTLKFLYQNYLCLITNLIILNIINSINKLSSIYHI